MSALFTRRIQSSETYHCEKKLPHEKISWLVWDQTINAVICTAFILVSPQAGAPK
jgi:hypothetical protein